MSVYTSKVDIFTFLSQSADVFISPNTVTTMLTPLSPDVHSVVEFFPNFITNIRYDTSIYSNSKF